jgi:hypothetical protein
MVRKPPALWFCLLMDLVGSLTYILPWWGEIGDVFWAPMSGLIFYFSFGGRPGALGGMISFIEEILPGLDFVPTFTIAWFIMHRRWSRQMPPIR